MSGDTTNNLARDLSETAFAAATGTKTIFQAVAATAAAVDVGTGAGDLAAGCLSLELISTEDCFVLIETVTATGVADNEDMLLKANDRWFVAVADVTRVSVIRSTTDGNLHIQEYL